jgi:hypothetical protein
MAVQVERVRLTDGDGHVAVRQWKQEDGSGASEVTLGTLSSGRWFVTTTAMAGEADVFPVESTARAYAAGLTSGPGWT